MLKALVLTVAACLVGCTEEEVPSCQQAVSHYYSSGCTFLDGRNNPPTQYTESQATQICRDVNVAVPARCEAFFEDWMFCLNDMPAGASDAQCIACTQEQDALFACD